MPPTTTVLDDLETLCMTQAARCARVVDPPQKDVRLLRNMLRNLAKLKRLAGVVTPTDVGDDGSELIAKLHR